MHNYTRNFWFQNQLRINYMCHYTWLHIIDCRRNITSLTKNRIDRTLNGASCLRIWNTDQEKKITGFVASSTLKQRWIRELRQAKWYKLVQENDIHYNVVNCIFSTQTRYKFIYLVYTSRFRHKKSVCKTIPLHIMHLYIIKSCIRININININIHFMYIIIVHNHVYNYFIIFKNNF